MVTAPSASRVHRFACAGPSPGRPHTSKGAVSPLFDGNEMSVNATPPGADGVVKLWAANHEGDLAMTAEAKLA